ERAFAPVGQFDRRRALEAGKTDRVDQLACPRVVLLQCALRVPEVQRVGTLPLQRNPDVLEYGQVRKHRGNLERADESHPGDCGGARPGDFAAVEEDLAARGGQEVREQVEARRLPGTVR